MASVARRCGSSAALLLVAVCSGCPASPDYDLLLRGGTVIDGSGAAPRVADVAIGDGRIAEVGDLTGRRARRVIDVGGLVVTPGFVDLHSHADLILLAERRTRERLLAAKQAQGVTTVIVGNCGLGVAPSSAEASEILGEVNGWMTPAGVSPRAFTVAEYLDRLEQAGLVLNVGTLVPHGPVRISAMGLTPGRPGPEQLEAMRHEVERGLDQGAFGLSTGLIYPPGMYSDTDELVALAKLVAKRGRLYSSHVRGSSETLLEATDELIDIARRSGARVHHSHLEAVGERFWPDIERVLALEDAAREEGLVVSHDVFPYTRAATMMAAIFPPWSLEGGVPQLLQRLADPETRARLEREIEQRRPEWPPWEPGGWPHNLVEAVGWDGIRLASVGPDGPSELVGRSLAELAEQSGRPPFELVAELMLSERGRVGQLVDQISGRERSPQDPEGVGLEPLLAILDHPAATVISDAEDYGRGVPHPAHAGAFARVLRLSRERGTPLEEIVHKMTGRPASLLGIEDRGVLRPGAWADLVVFDPARVTDRATWQSPRLTAVGIEWVLINGRLAVERGQQLPGLPGKVLRAD